MAVFEKFAALFACGLMCCGLSLAQTPSQPLDASDPSITTKPDLDPLRSRPPDYPDAAKRKLIEGEARLKLCLDANGSVTSRELTRSTGHEDLDKEAINWSRRAKFKPAKVNGVAVAVCNYNYGYVWRLDPVTKTAGYARFDSLPADARPKLILAAPEPEYPAKALEARAQGKVKVSLCIDATGRVENMALAPPRMDGFLEAATVKWAAAAKYSPGTRNGAAVGVCGVEVERDWKLPG